MNISYNWLKEFLKIDLELDRISEILTDIGLEVEGVSKYQQFKGGLKGLVVGKVLTCIKHPNADRLKLTTVDIGQEIPLQIVCGAPNARVGIKVPCALVGAKLPDFEIKKAKLRGAYFNIYIIYFYTFFINFHIFISSSPCLKNAL